MCGVFFFFIALPDFYRMYHLHVLRLLLHRFRNVVRTRSQFHLVSPIALDIILFYYNAVYQFVLVSRVVLEIPFLVALSNDVQSCIFRSTRILFIFASHLHNKKRVYTHRYGEKNKHGEQRWILKIWVGKKQEKRECTRRRTHTRTHAQRKTLDPCKMEGYFMLRCWEDVYAHLVTHLVNNAQFPATLVAASLLRETRLQVKKATERREPLARFICGWTGGAPIWCQRYRRRVTDRQHPGVARAQRPSHVRQVGLTPCPGWTNWRSLGNVRQNLAHWRNSKASLWALLAWVAACHI